MIKKVDLPWFHGGMFMFISFMKEIKKISKKEEHEK